MVARTSTVANVELGIVLAEGGALRLQGWLASSAWGKTSARLLKRDGDGQLDADMRRRPRRCVLARLVDV